MATKSNWMVDAPDLIWTELQDRLHGDFDIIAVEPDSFFFEGEEIRFVTVTFKKGHPAIDVQRFDPIEFDIFNLLEERGFVPVPTVDYRDERSDGEL